ncbi:hypothetical protein CYMTET_15299 [Cymbomonas tetramitiformis]|uniref:Uncharacterized protein n=1 Tax=Cymbomonas tetramitiformis TaxID=36881 RepID=A0AAE0L959_9CHLO|nr:hypothetical protein CYMTET_15299 [Cymbomonas tetramitiformis]
MTASSTSLLPSDSLSSGSRRCKNCVAARIFSAAVILLTCVFFFAIFIRAGWHQSFVGVRFSSTKDVITLSTPSESRSGVDPVSLSVQAGMPCPSTSCRVRTLLRSLKLSLKLRSLKLPAVVAWEPMLLTSPIEDGNSIQRANDTKELGQAGGAGFPSARRCCPLDGPSSSAAVSHLFLSLGLVALR